MRAAYSGSSGLMLVLVQINPTLFGPVALLELVWVAINGGGFFYTMGNFVDAGRSVQAARTDPIDEADVEVALLTRFMHSCLALFQGAMLFVGLLAMTTPPPQIAHVATVANIATTLIFVGGSLLLAFMSRTVKQRRLRIYELLRARAAAIALSIVERDELKEEIAGLERTALETDTVRHADRDAGRDAGRDDIRDPARDLAHDLENDKGLTEGST